MKIKNNKGYVAIDMVIAIVGVIVFSGLIISLMYSNFLGNAKTKKEAIAVIYLTEIMENIGIATYEEVIQENIENLKPIELTEEPYKDVYEVNIDIEYPNDENGQPIEFIKTITATISYTVGNKTYSNVLERVKIKE